jgi:hypothetical protein
MRQVKLALGRQRRSPQITAERALRPLDVDPVGPGTPRSPVHQQARRIEDVIAHPMRVQKIVQPEAVVGRIVARGHRDLDDWPAQFPGELML